MNQFPIISDEIPIIKYFWSSNKLIEIYTETYILKLKYNKKLIYLIDNKQDTLIKLLLKDIFNIDEDIVEIKINTIPKQFELLEVVIKVKMI